MAIFRTAMAGGLLFIMSLMLLGRRVEGEVNGRGKTEVAGDSVVYLGQERDPWRPLIRTTVNLVEIRSIKSSFQFRTFDPEGVIFYGDTKNGEDWFILSLKDGHALMQISKEDILVSVTGGRKLNDGKWHTLEVSNKGKFVTLVVDGSPGLEVGMQSKQTQEVISGELRLALGGILVDKEKLIVELDPQMDGCVREGSWLNLSVPWEAEAEELWLCHQNIQPGSYFSGKGLAIFNTSGGNNVEHLVSDSTRKASRYHCNKSVMLAAVFSIDEDQGFRLEFWGDFSQLDGTVLSVESSQEQLMFTAVASNDTKEVVLTFKEQQFTLENTFKRLLVTFLKDSVKVAEREDESNAVTFLAGAESRPSYLTSVRGGRFAVGGLLGEGVIGSRFLTGCLEKVQVQGKDLDLDLSVKHMSVSSHSCPA